MITSRLELNSPHMRTAAIPPLQTFNAGSLGLSTDFPRGRLRPKSRFGSSLRFTRERLRAHWHKSTLGNRAASPSARSCNDERGAGSFASGLMAAVIGPERFEPAKWACCEEIKIPIGIGWSNAQRRLIRKLNSAVSIEPP